MSEINIFFYIIAISTLFYMYKISFSNVNYIFEIIISILIIKILYHLIKNLLKSSLISLNQVNTRQKLYFCKTYHARFWPVKHSFKYPVLFVGVDLDLLEQQQYKEDGHSLFEIGYNNSSIIFNINDDDYLGKINSSDDNLENPYIQKPKNQIKSIKEKLLWHLKQHNIPTDDLSRFELITMPRFFGYAFNPASFHYCYNNNNELKVIILEVNNTFGEKHLHVLNRDTDNEKESRNGYDMSFTMKRTFHVSPFNDRLGTYKVLCNDPSSSGYLDMRIIMYADPDQDNESQLKKKMVATVSGPSYILSMSSLLYAIIRYPFDIFLTFPRILKEAYKLHYNKKLGIYHRPIPIEGTVVKLEPNSIELYAQEIITSYLRYLIENSLESAYITINLPDKNKLPIIIRPSNLPIISFSNTITINLHDYTFFTNLLINQNIYRALLIGYFGKSWDCDKLELLLKLFFNNRSEVEDNKKEPLHRDHKINLSNFENRISTLRRWYWKKLFNNRESSGERAKKEFDRLLQNMWPPVGVDRDFIASVVQNDVCFDIRLDATINSHEEVAVALRDLFAMNNEGNTIALFGYTHLYMLSPFTFPSSATISNVSPIIASKLHLLPFPPRYLPYENKEPLKHPVDKFIHSSKLFTNKDKLKYTWIMLLMVLGYFIDALFWQMITKFVEGPRGNPFFAEKWVWEGIVDLLKRYERKDKDEDENEDEDEDEEQWAECESDIESDKSINIRSSSEYCKNEEKKKRVFDGWEVVYERINNNDKLKRVKPISTPSLPSPSTEFKLAEINPIIEEERQQRLWLFTKIFREAILLRTD